MQSRKPSFISLFSGAGTIPLSLECSGFSNLGVIISKKCKTKTINVNRKDWNFFPFYHKEDITLNSARNYLIDEKNNLDLLSCFIYLEATFVENSSENEKYFINEYIESFYNFLKDFAPKTFLLNFDKDNTPKNFDISNLNSIKILMNKVEKLGYKIYIEKVKSIYFGVSQKTIHLVIVGVRNDLNKIATFEFPKKRIRPTFLKSIINNIEESDGESYSKSKKEILNYVPPGDNWRSVPKEITNKYKNYFPVGEEFNKNYFRRLKTNEICPEIYIASKRRKTLHCHPFENRPLNIRESARCKSFPDFWKFSGTTEEQYKQIISEVPYKITTAVCLKIKEFLKKIEKNTDI